MPDCLRIGKGERLYVTVGIKPEGSSISTFRPRDVDIGLERKIGSLVRVISERAVARHLEARERELNANAVIEAVKARSDVSC